VPEKIMNVLFYQELGKDKSHLSSVVLLHGLFGMSDNLLGLAKELALSFHVIIPDLINHGRSPHRAKMDYPGMAEDVINLMDSLDIEKASIIGHSMGGKVAMQLACTYPDRVEKLVIVDISPVAYPARHLEILDALQKIANTSITARKDADALLAEKIPDLSLRQFFLKNMVRNDEGFWQWRFGLRQIKDSYKELSVAPDMQKVFNKEALFIKGELSDYILPEHEAIVRKWFPAVKLKVIQGAGHWLHAEKPIVFNRTVKQFLQG
jgi:esterase